MLAATVSTWCNKTLAAAKDTQIHRFANTQTHTNTYIQTHTYTHIQTLRVF
ncbi:unnamed protein product [Enterobius vermicularis]|uniref:Secreted protein n=1 Tax=Enterobius vermicularis TaxID=51028 RepID=A0A0N4UVX6_ENTVE|nr:unnamed protein product [Enterobius vermicularis]